MLSSASPFGPLLEKTWGPGRPAMYGLQDPVQSSGPEVEEGDGACPDLLCAWQAQK